MPAPVAVESARQHSRRVSRGAKPGSPPSRPGQYRQLMTEQEILGVECLAVMHGRTDEAEEEK